MIIIYFLSMNDMIFVGVDIGGTLTKVCLAAQKLNISPSFQIHISGVNLDVHSRSFNNIENCLNWIRQSTVSFKMIRLGMTGGGAVKYGQMFQENFPKVSIIKLNEFQSNIKGLSFIQSASLPVTLTTFQKISQNTLHLTSAQVTLNQCQLPIQLVSLGSGVNFRKIGLGKDGFQSLKVQDPKTSYDGYILDGTCLGGGYIFGLISLLTQQSQSQKIVQIIKSEDKNSKIYEQLMVNLMQSAISLSCIHKIPTILANGSILRIKPLIKPFEQAMKLSLEPFPFKRNLISLDHFEGYLGNFGLLYSLIYQSE